MIEMSCRRPILLCLLITAVLTGSASAHTFPMSIRQPGLSMQEFWRDGQPFYIIVNGGDDSLSLRIRTARFSGMNKLYGPFIALWSSPARSTMVVRAIEPAEPRVIELQANEEWAGYLYPPARPAESPMSEGDLILTNGDRRDVWIEHDSITLPEAAQVEVTVRMSPEVRWIAFGNYAAMRRYTWPDRRVPSWEPPRMLRPLSVSSPEARIVETDSLIVIHRPIDAPDFDSIYTNLVLETPDVDEESAVEIIGAVAYENGQGLPTWTLVVKPDEER